MQIIDICHTVFVLCVSYLGAAPIPYVQDTILLLDNANDQQCAPHTVAASASRVLFQLHNPCSHLHNLDEVGQRG